MESIFSKIIAGNIPSYKIAEDDYFYSFLDIKPLALGHTLVVPKIQIDKFYDLPDIYLSRYLPFCSLLCKSIELAIACERVALSIIGIEVPHAHIHLVPLNSMNDINFSAPRLNPSEEEIRSIANKIASNYKNLN